MKINDRLKKIGDLVEANSFCLDVGCDHGLLDIYLVKKRVGIKAIASDIAEGPLKQASNNIKREHLENEIEVKLGDGLEAYTEQVDTVIISGMGGRSIVGILKDRPDVLKKVKTIIISPNNFQEDVKKFICKKGFYIDNEEFVKDNRFIYQIIVCKQGHKRYSRKEYFMGPVFLNKRGPLFREYYERELKSREIILSLLPKGYYFKRLQLRREMKWIKEELDK